MTRESLDHPFSAFWRPDSRILILGSFPSPGSRKNGFYYGHPGNRFWRVLANVFLEPVPETLQEKQTLLLSHRLALWDTAGHVSIEGASDASARDIVPNDLYFLLEGAQIHSILLNGRLAGQIFERHMVRSGMPEHVILPSTSAANASWSLERLIQAWQPYLLD